MTSQYSNQVPAPSAPFVGGPQYQTNASYPAPVQNNYGMSQQNSAPYGAAPAHMAQGGYQVTPHIQGVPAGVQPQSVPYAQSGPYAPGPVQSAQNPQSSRPIYAKKPSVSAQYPQAQYPQNQGIYNQPQQQMQMAAYPQQPHSMNVHSHRPNQLSPQQRTAQEEAGCLALCGACLCCCCLSSAVQ